MPDIKTLSKSWESILQDLQEINNSKIDEMKRGFLQTVEESVKEVDKIVKDQMTEVNKQIELFKKIQEEVKTLLASAKGIIESDMHKAKKSISEEKEQLLERIDASEKKIDKAMETLQTSIIAPLEKRVSDLAADVTGQARFIVLNKKIANFAQEMISALQKLLLAPVSDEEPPNTEKKPGPPSMAQKISK